MRIAVITTFYPNSQMPRRAVFVQNLVRALSSMLDVTIVAPVPYAPAIVRTARFRKLTAIPSLESDGSLVIHHPRFVAIPRLQVMNGIAYSAGIMGTLVALRRYAPPDVLHCHCAYPDAVGVAWAARLLRLPFVVTAHGSDINVYSERPAIRAQMRAALREAGAVVAVSRPIQEKICDLLPESAEKVVHIPCAAADSDVFYVRDRMAARRQLGLEEHSRIVTFVGQLVPIKNVEMLVRAWGALFARGRVHGGDRLVIVGDGPLRRNLETTAKNERFGCSIVFLGELSQRELADWLCAADLLCLPSRSEGTPNVIIEALASGRPVVATSVGGIPDLVTVGENGVLVPVGDPEGLADGLWNALRHNWDPAQIAATSRNYTWDALARRNVEVLAQVAGRSIEGVL